MRRLIFLFLFPYCAWAGVDFQDADATDYYTTGSAIEIFCNTASCPDSMQWFDAVDKTDDTGFRYLFSNNGVPGTSESLNWWYDENNATHTVNLQIDDGTNDTGIVATSIPLDPTSSAQKFNVLQREGDTLKYYVAVPPNYEIQMVWSDDWTGWSSINSANVWDIGRRQDGNATRYYSGRLARLSMTDETLTVAQMEDMAWNGTEITSISVTCTHYWTFATAAATISDGCGTNDLTKNGTPTTDSNFPTFYEYSNTAATCDFTAGTCTLTGTGYGTGPDIQVIDNFDNGTLTNDIDLTNSNNADGTDGLFDSSENTISAAGPVWGDWDAYGNFHPVYYGEGHSGSQSMQGYDETGGNALSVVMQDNSGGDWFGEALIIYSIKPALCTAAQETASECLENMPSPHPSNGASAYNATTWLLESTHTVTFTASSTTVTYATTPGTLSVGDPVQFETTGALPSELSEYTTYWIVSVSSPNVEISATEGGAAITFSGTGSGTHTVQGGDTLGSGSNMKETWWTSWGKTTPPDPDLITLTLVSNAASIGGNDRGIQNLNLLFSNSYRDWSCQFDWSRRKVGIKSDTSTPSTVLGRIYFETRNSCHDPNMLYFGDYVFDTDGEKFDFTADTVNDEVEITGTEFPGIWAIDDIVTFSTTVTLPAPLAAATNYYIVAANNTTGVYQVSATQGGDPIDITDTGTGTHTVQGDPDAQRFNQITIAAYFRSGMTWGVNMLYDEIYIATGTNALKHIELCTSATYSNCTDNTWVQWPTAWANTSTTFYINAGNLPTSGGNIDLANVYLYIADSNGIVNEDGIVMTEAAGGGGGESTDTSLGHSRRLRR